MCLKELKIFNTLNRLFCLCFGHKTFIVFEEYVYICLTIHDKLPGGHDNRQIFALKES